MINDWKKVDVTYDYHDENGTRLFQVGRWNDPKSFSQRKDNGNGNWTYQMNDVRRVPFMLPQMLRAIARGETVYVVEGEKDAQNLQALGFAATTSAQGAKSKWPGDWADFFKGAKLVVVIADNDAPGLECAKQRAGIIARSAEDVRIIEKMPGVEEKGDVSDWIANGGTYDALEQLAVDAPKIEASEPSTGTVAPAVTEKSSVMGQWGALLRQFVDDGHLDDILKFAGPWRANGTRSLQCPFAAEHSGNEEHKPSAYLMTQTGSGLGCDKPGHKRWVLGMLRDIGWAQDTDDARRKLRALGYKLPVSRSLQLVTLSDVEETPMEWLWEGRIPYNNMTLLPGDGGIGKSFVTMQLAAAVTNGSKLPIDDGWQTVNKGDVLLANFEDGVGNGIAQIIKKRARLCEVDMSRLHVIAGMRDEKGKIQPFSRDHVSLIADHLRENPEVRLVIIDPLMSFIGKADVFRDNEVREALAEIVDVISKCEHKVALIIVHHNRKAAGEKGVDKVAGSVGLTNYARSVIAADYEKCYDDETGEESEGRKMLTVIKGNHAGPTSPVPFGIDLEGRFWWQPADTTLKGKNPAMPRKVKGQKPRARTKLVVAKELLEEMLTKRGDWYDAAPIKDAAKLRYVSEDTLGNARKQLNIQTRVEQNRAQWMLPEEPPF